MKISSTVSFSLLSEDGDAVFVFNRPPLNEELSLDNIEGENETARLKRVLEKRLKHLVSVDGLFHADGTPVKKEDLLTLGLDRATTFAIIAGYNEALNGKTESAEKKDSASA